jgi:superfamily I DNA/RNA helicase
MKYVHTKDLFSGLSDLNRRGGRFQRAAKSVYEMLGKISDPGSDPFRGYATTNKGEKRLKHCIKYDLSGGCRLVTVVNADITFLLFVGIHTEVDKWLDRNRGKDFAVDDANMLVETLRPAEVRESGKVEVVPEREIPGEACLVERLNKELIDVLLEPLTFKAGRAISDLTISSSDDDINSACALIEDESVADTALDVLIALAGGNIKEAEARIRLYQGTYRELEEAEEIVGGQDLQFVPTDSREWVILYEHFAKTAGYKDWMLFLHPDQAYVVEEDFNGSAKLLGVSGSGKTCVVVKRALRLAEKYSGESILVLTLNRSLAKLIDDLMDEAVPKNLRPQIEVKPFFEVCQQLIYQFEPGSERYYSDVTWLRKGGVDEHIDAVWTEFYRCDLNNNEAAVMHPVHDSLIAQGVDAEHYIREEFDWIRSAIPHQEREAYLELERTGRSFPLSKQFRKLLLEGLEAWERKMRSVGVIDGLGLVSALQPWLDQVKPYYRSILIDESQDFGTSELEIIRRLVEPGENDLFICGDAAQQVSSKYQKLGEAGISIPGARSRKILKNYRNSREILTAAYEVLHKHVNEFHLDSEDFEVLDPEFADFHGPAPLLLSAVDLVQEIGNALVFVQEEISNNHQWKACIALAGYSLYEIQVFAKRLNIPVLDGTRSIDQHSIYLSDLAQTKGFEFDVVVVANVSEGILPNPNIPEMEQAKDLAQLYVAMTRARTQLVVSYHGQPSSLVAGLDEVFLLEDWSSYNSSTVKTCGVPPRLAELNEDTLIPFDITVMDGHQFLYTEHAIGLPQRLVDALREKVGRSDPRSGRMTLAVDIGYAHQRTIDDFRARNQFGREVTRDFQELGMKLELSRLHKIRLEPES